MSMTALTATKLAQNLAERQILETPTSERRNLLTDANIMLTMALEKLNEAESA